MRVRTQPVGGISLLVDEVGNFAIAGLHPSQGLFPTCPCRIRVSVPPPLGHRGQRAARSVLRA